MRARGLKLILLPNFHLMRVSRPMRARGLKPLRSVLKLLTLVSRPMRARGLKLKRGSLYGFSFGRAPCGRVG